MSVELKIKIKNLADEARTIRVEERKLRGMDKWRLQHHRKTVVRMAARRTQIAYAVIKGRDWTANASYDPFTARSDQKEVERMVRKYGAGQTVPNLAEIDHDKDRTVLLGDSSGGRGNGTGGDRRLENDG